jgi:hypothetical protein
VLKAQHRAPVLPLAHSSGVRVPPRSPRALPGTDGGGPGDDLRARDVFGGLREGSERRARAPAPRADPDSRRPPGKGPGPLSDRPGIGSGRAGRRVSRAGHSTLPPVTFAGAHAGRLARALRKDSSKRGTSSDARGSPDLAEPEDLGGSRPRRSSRSLRPRSRSSSPTRRGSSAPEAEETQYRDL